MYNVTRFYTYSQHLRLAKIYCLCKWPANEIKISTMERYTLLCVKYFVMVKPVNGHDGD